MTKEKIEIRKPYGPPPVSNIDCSGEGRTHQSFKDECDINNIMKRFERDGVLTHAAKVEGKYGDFTGAVDYKTALDQVHKAGEMFMSLPAFIRTRFDNDPGAFLEFASDPDNVDEMIDMGLLPEGFDDQYGTPEEPPEEAAPEEPPPEEPEE